MVCYTALMRMGGQEEDQGDGLMMYRTSQAYHNKRQRRWPETTASGDK